MAIGNASTMIDKGSWQTDPQPKLLKSKKYYSFIYRFGFQYKNFKFLCEYLVDKKNLNSLFFIYPYYREWSKTIIVFSDPGTLYTIAPAPEGIVLINQLFAESAGAPLVIGER